MRSLAPSPPAARRLRLPAGLLLTTAAFGLLALLPASRAEASAPTVTVPPAAEVEALLDKTPLGTLTAGKLAEALSHVQGFENLESAKVKEALEKAISELSGKGATLEELLHGGEGAAKVEQALHEVLGTLGTKLGELLGGSGGNARAKLEETLRSTPVGELIGKLLGGSAEPQALLAQILQALPAEKLQSLLGSLPAGESVLRSTVEELAHRLATTGEALAGQFGDTVEQLPGTAMALTTPLKNGETLAALNAAKGLTLGTIDTTEKTIGTTGGTGTPGSPGAPGAPGTTVTVTTASSQPQPSAPAGSAAAAKPGKLRLVSHKVKRMTATIVLEVPSAGKLSASGRGVHSIGRETAQAERVTLHPSLTKASTSTLRRHHRRKLTVPLKVAFKPVGGSTTTVTVSLAYS